MRYECNCCGSICDPGELRGGICFDCREESGHEDSQTVAKFFLVVREQEGGQMAFDQILQEE